MTLRADTKDVFYKSIPADALTLTFKDAIEATLHLGYQYIWIDSLCIEQDSPGDWSAESQRMGEYYSNSVCNLAASKESDDASGGCFTNRNPLAAQQCLVRDTWVNTSPQLTFYVHDSQYQYNCSVRDSGLSSRGWIVQEKILSPRTLHFGYDQIFWDCLGHRACEAYPAHWIGQRAENKIGLWPDHMFRNKSNVLENRLSNFLHWEKVVEQYSKCSLTLPEKDRLVALSGIAKAFGDPPDYLAGLWRANLDILLLWQPCEGASRFKSFVAPSWSWASMDGGVRFREVGGDSTSEETTDVIIEGHLLPILSTTQSFITLVSAQVQNEGAEAMGRVIGGHIQLKGLLFRVDDVHVTSNALHLLWDDESEGTEAGIRASDGSCRLMPVRLSHRSMLFGLTLQKTGNKTPGEYRGVGLFVAQIPSTKSALKASAFSQERLEYRPRPLEEGEYLEKTDHSKGGIEEYVISIV
ncbi:hypothetical protein NPX13_g8634 [Xylaria arbuscula]|uniref:Heterokaryon incompatibility domain-containing protein n=1 Tax=Xylaria arbuscula TaxID=114810 RepID=A0A9W8N8B6_9PEZI|nr:hypothetical protein NPX13_g8634 [Xylaria arbuscula]